MVNDGQEEEMCPRFPEPVPLQHPIPTLKEALEKVGVYSTINPLLLLLKIKIIIIIMIMRFNSIKFIQRPLQ